MYKFACFCLLLACIGSNVEGLSCVNGFGVTVDTVTNTTSPMTACSGDDQRCLRFSGQVVMYNQTISGVALMCSNASRCDALQDAEACQSEVVRLATFISTSGGFPSTTVTVNTCEAACCMTDDCNAQSIEEIRAINAASGTDEHDV